MHSYVKLLFLKDTQRSTRSRSGPPSGPPPVPKYAQALKRGLDPEGRRLSLHPVQIIILILIFTKERRGGGLPLQRLHTGEKHLDYTTVPGGPTPPTAGQQPGQRTGITSSSSSSSSLGGEGDFTGPLTWNTGSSFSSPSAPVRLTQPDRNTGLNPC